MVKSVLRFDVVKESDKPGSVKMCKQDLDIYQCRREQLRLVGKQGWLQDARIKVV